MRFCRAPPPNSLQQMTRKPRKPFPPRQTHTHHHPKMTAPNAFRLEVATLDDIPAITELWFAAFTDPEFRRMWPDTSGVRTWWDDTNRHDMVNKPFQRYLKVVDPSSTDASGRARIIAYAKWDLAMIEDRGRRYLPWHEDMAAEECDAFFEREDKERQRLMGEQKHYCRICPATPEFLALLTTARSGFTRDTPRLPAPRCRLHAREMGLRPRRQGWCRGLCGRE